MNAYWVLLSVWEQGEGEDDTSMRKQIETWNGGKVILTPRDVVDLIRSCLLVFVLWCGSSLVLLKHVLVW